ncbi:MAG: ABC transporter permease subunit [Spirochaetota bacterium]|nr:MAG: ABC transporter permease subunit [Spirochaetota bacterium]
MTRVTSKPWLVLIRLSKKQRRNFLLGALGIAIGLGVWLALVYFKLVPKYALPTPVELGKLWQRESPRLLYNIWLTVMRALCGFALGSIMALFVTFIRSWIPVIDTFIEPIVQIFKPVPPLVLSPFMIIWFGSNNKGVITLAIWGSFFLMLVEGHEALKATPLVYLRAASTLGESKLGMRLRVMFPAAIPHLIGAMRITLLLGINLVILGEFSAAAGGIGEIIVHGYRFLRPDLLFFGVLVGIAVAVVLDLLVRIISIRLRRWV